MGYPCRTEAWISAAVKCNVQECHLELDGIEEALCLLDSLVNCVKLTTLDIEMSGFLILTSPICLSSLKILSLRDITFPNDHSAQQLFYGCPVLEDLSLHYCDWMNVTDVVIFSSRLRRLTLVDEEFAAPYRSHCYEFVILGCELEYLYYSGQFQFELCIFNSALLKEVHIYPRFYGDTSRRPSYCLLKLLRSITHVSNLMLGSDSALVRLLLSTASYAC